MYTGISCCLLIPLFFTFLSFQFSNIKRFRHTFLRNCEALKVETWYTRGQWADVLCIPYSGCCYLLSPYFFIFLSLQFSNKKMFFTLSSDSETVCPRRLKLGTHMNSEQMYRAYRNQSAAAYSLTHPFIFHFSFSPIFKL